MEFCLIVEPVPAASRVNPLLQVLCSLWERVHPRRGQPLQSGSL